MTDPVQTDIVKLDRLGIGVGTYGDRPFLVPGTLPGECISATVLGGGQYQSYGKVRDWTVKSPHRVEPPCVHAGSCGGCTLQHMSLDFQQDWKRSRLLDGLSQAGLHEIEVRELVSLEKGSAFRGKAQFMLQCQEDETWEIGLYATRSNTLIALDSCWVQDTLTQQLLEGLNQQLRQRFVAPGLKGVLGRSNGKGVLLTWLLTEKPSPQTRTVLKEAGQSIPGVVGCFYHLSPQEGNALIGKETVHLSGATSLEYQVRDVVFSAGPVSFVQTTLEGAELLVDEVRRRAPQSIEHLVDLYGGVGLFALALGKRAKSVTVVERDGPSARDGQENLKGMGTYVCGDVSRVKDQIAPMDVMVVDPPRAGLSSPVIEWIGMESKPRQLVYVSCSESTLIRDLQALLSMGYQVSDVTPVDLFPHTPHLELVTHLHRVD